MSQDGLRGCNVRWESFTRVRNLTKPTLGRKALQFLFHVLAPLLLVIGISIVSVPGYKQAGAAALAFGILIVLASPYGLRKLYGGKFWATQVCAGVLLSAQLLTLFPAMAIWVRGLSSD